MLSKQALAYVFDDSRGGDVAVRLLGETQGNLLIDGYSAYNTVTVTDAEGRERVGCCGTRDARSSRQ